MDKVLMVKPRAERGKKLAGLRASGLLPAVMYGAKEASVSISVPRAEFEKLFAEAGESTVLTLKGLDHEMDVLVHDVAYDPVLSTPIHVDFIAIDKNKKLQVHVPIEFEGEAPATKAGGAVLTKVLHEVEVECLPKDLPQHISVSLDGLTEIGSTIHVKDLPKINGVVILAEADDVVAIVSEVVEEAETVPEAIDMTAIEVEQKGKKEEGEEENT